MARKYPIGHGKAFIDTIYFNQLNSSILISTDFLARLSDILHPIERASSTSGLTHASLCRDH